MARERFRRLFRTPSGYDGPARAEYGEYALDAGSDADAEILDEIRSRAAVEAELAGERFDPMSGDTAARMRPMREIFARKDGPSDVYKPTATKALPARAGAVSGDEAMYGPESETIHLGDEEELSDEEYAEMQGSRDDRATIEREVRAAQVAVPSAAREMMRGGSAAAGAARTGASLVDEAMMADDDPSYAARRRR